METKLKGLEKLQSLPDSKKLVYKTFISSLLMLGRDTVKIMNNVPDISKTMIPHLVLQDKNGVYCSIIYSPLKKGWDIHISGVKNKEPFNPTTVTGVLEFLENYDGEKVIEAVNTLHNEIVETLNQYGLQ